MNLKHLFFSSLAATALAGGTAVAEGSITVITSFPDSMTGPIEAAFEAAAAAPSEPDRPAIAGCDTSGPWWRLARHWLTLLSALPPERISALDLAAYADTYENWPVSDGYGALIARTSAHVPVHLGVAVRSIDTREALIRLETSRTTSKKRCGRCALSRFQKT